MKRTKKYIWQCYSEADECFYNPVVHDSLITGPIKSTDEQQSLDLWFNSTDEAEDFRDRCQRREVSAYNDDEPYTWILCKLTIKKVKAI